MKIVFMGTPEQSAAVLADLLAAKHNILCVITQPDRPKGRGQKVAFSPVKDLALKNDLPLEQPEKAKDAVALIRSLAPDIVVVVAYGKLLPRELLNVPKYGCVNVHASLLPKYRGAAPVQWALLKGEKETGITIMRIDERLDTGEIISQKKVRIEEEDDAGGLMQKLFACGSKLLLEALKKIEKGEARYVPQNEADATFAPAISKESGELDWKKSAAEIHDRVRALVHWPVAQTFYREKRLKIWKSRVHLADLSSREHVPGSIVEIVKNEGFIVSTGRGHILIQEVQTEGGKRMKAYDFVIGHDVKIGETLPN